MNDGPRTRTDPDPLVDVGGAVLAHGTPRGDASVGALVLGMRAARRGRNVVVLVGAAAHGPPPHDDLGHVLGDPVGSDPCPVADPVATAAGGALWATVLDTQATMEHLVSEIADHGEAAAIVDNRVFGALARSAAGAEFAALERWRGLHDRGHWDLVVCAAPPMVRPAELVDAPQRFTGFFDDPVVRAVTSTRRPLARLTDAAASAFTWAVRGLAGPDAVDDALGFLRALATMETALDERADRAADLLASAGHVVVSAADEAAVAGAADVVRALRARELTVLGAVVDGLHPPPLPLSSEDRAQLVASGSIPLAAQLRWYDQLAEQAAAERRRVDRLVELTTNVLELRASPRGTGDTGDLRHLADRAIGRRSRDAPDPVPSAAPGSPDPADRRPGSH